MARIIFATLGSSGDVRPLLAVAVAAKGRGHSVSIATTSTHQSTIDSTGVSHIEFGEDGFLESSETRRALMERTSGFSLWMSLFNLDRLEDLYDTLYKSCVGADAIISTPFVMAAHLVAEKRQLPLVNCCFSPVAYLPDPEIGRGADPNALVWVKRLNALRRDLDLPRMAFPQMGRFNSAVTLGLYPSCLHDSSKLTIRTISHIGYPLLRCPSTGLNVGLEEWMARGPFCLFTFGSYVDKDVQNMVLQAINACDAVNLRCLYIAPFGIDFAQPNDDKTRIEKYIAHDLIIPLASVVVHHGGTGTLSEVLFYNKPAVIVPFGLDQHFNAERLSQLGLAEVLAFDSVNSASLAAAIDNSRARHKARLDKERNVDWDVGVEYADKTWDFVEELIPT